MRLWLTLGIVMTSLPVALACTGFAQGPDLKCQPAAMYKGDTWTVELPMPHRGASFSISSLDSDNKPMMISFEALPKDTIPSVIPPMAFAKMTRIKLLTAQAKGSLGSWTFGAPNGPTALRPPEPIFTQTAWYMAMLGYYFGSEDSGQYAVATCDVAYFDRPRPKPGEKVPKDALFVPSNPGPHHNPEAYLSCPSDTVYRGETVTLGLPEYHQAYDFAVLDPAWKILFLSVVRGRYGVGAPMIPARRFARMRRVTLSTSTARGSLYGPSAPTGSPLRPIFTRSGWYLAMIGTDFAQDDDGPFGSCWFHYIMSGKSRKVSG